MKLRFWHREVEPARFSVYRFAPEPYSQASWMIRIDQEASHAEFVEASESIDNVRLAQLPIGVWVAL